MYKTYFSLTVAILAASPGSALGDTLIGLDSDWRFMAGTSEASLPDTTLWRTVDFDDSTWPTLPAPFWYGDGQPAPGTQLDGMRDNYSSVFLRRSFVLDQSSIVDELVLGAQSDDGFIAWINGIEVARFNMPSGPIPHTGSASGALSEPIDFQTYTLVNASDFLVDGVNVLAVHAFNASLGGSSDFVINVSLTSSVDVTPPTLESVLPTTESPLTRFTEVEVLFSEPVTDVEAQDLLVNGVPATSVTAFSGAQYLFSFAEPEPGLVTLTWRENHQIQDLGAQANPFSGATWVYELDPDYVPTTVVISEFMADNNRTLNDSFGDDSDWIELHNNGLTPVDLTGWLLTDSAEELAKWRLPAVTLNPNDYLLIFASGRDLTNSAGPLHTNFKLDADGGYLALLTPGANVASAFGGQYPLQVEDVSYGRDTADPNWVGFFTVPTPGAPNTTGGLGFAPRVEFSQDESTFTAAFDLGLSVIDAPPGTRIRYTLDGSAVTEASPRYTSPIRLTTTIQVRARAYQDDLLPGPVRTRIYLAISPELQNFSTDLPIVILHNDGGGAVPASFDQPVMVQAFEPIGGKSSMTNAPNVSSRGVFHIRGSSTLYYPKRSFFLETQDNTGNGRNVDLLGLPKESDWVLYAPNNFEPVLIHNPVAFELSRQMGQYASRTRFCVVFLNTTGGTVTSANYNGIYVLEEKIKVDRNRVAIDQLQLEHRVSPEVTGGYLLSVDRSAPGEGKLYAGGQGFNILSPKYREITSPQRAAQEAYITDYLNSFYNALTGPTPNDPIRGYGAFLDIDAAINHHVQGVVTFNVDGLRLSGYLHKPRGGKITMGPVWDFDRTQGSTDGRDFNPLVWRSTVGDRGTDMFNASGTYANPWYAQLFQDVDFWQRWIDRYQELRRDVLSDTNVAAIIQGFADQVVTEQTREQARWGVQPRSGSVGSGGYAHEFPGTYQGEVDWMKYWYRLRLAFMDNNFLAPPDFDLAPGPIESGAQLSLSGPPGATLYYTLDGTDPRQPGGNLSPAAQTYTQPVVLTANARVFARARDLSHHNLTGPNNPPLTTPWSGAQVATFVVQRPTLAISEIMYHPAPPSEGDTNAVNNFEFIELVNTGNSDLDLVGVQFTRGIEFTFSPTNAITSLAPGERVVLVSHLPAFTSRYPSVQNVAGEYLGQLDNAGERLTVIGRLQEPILDLEYADSEIRITDGFGFSLVPTADPPTNPFATLWRASRELGGSPGDAEPIAPDIPTIVINEALTHTDLPQVDSVELLNPTTTSVDIGGWWLTDDLRAPKKFRFPEPTLLPPGGYLVLAEPEFTQDPTHRFLLSSLGDEIYLFSSDASGNLTGYLDGFGYGAARNGVSFGRHRNSVESIHFVAQTTNSLGTTNAGPRVGPVVISEVMYQLPGDGVDSDAGLHEFIEIQNVSPDPVALFDPQAPTNTWKLGGGIEYTFPTNVTLLTEERLLVVGFNPDKYPAKKSTFRDRYGLGLEARIFGPFQGRLDNAGDRARLLSPDPPQTAASPTPGFVPYVLIDQLDYAPTSPWPTNAAGNGASLQRILSSAYGNDPANWEAAPPSPGRINRSTGSIDSDADGLPDAWEIAHDLNPSEATGDDGADGDPDQDQLRNLDEWLRGLDPRNADSDADGMPDGWESQSGLDPANRLGPNGGDGDPDGDQLSNREESTHGTNPWSADTDSDQLPDLWEVQQGLDPTDASGDNGANGDPDGDGSSNLQEWQIGTRPMDPGSSLRLSAVNLGNGRVYLKWSTQAGRTYTLLTREDAVDGEWRVFRSIPSSPVDATAELLFNPDETTNHVYRLATPIQ